MPTLWTQFLRSALAEIREVPRLKISDRFPDMPLRNQWNQPRRFRRDFIDDGGAVILTTMYTTCRGSCPVTNMTLAGLREALWPVFRKRLTILSLTLEPHVDTPAVLREYADAYGAGEPRNDAGDWHFLTGQSADLERLRRSLGFFDLDPRVDRDVTQHASTILFGNPTTDRWASLPAQSPERLLIESIRRVAGFTFEQKYGIPA